MTEFEVYLWLMLDNLKVGGGVFGTISAVIIAVTVIMIAVNVADKTFSSKSLLLYIILLPILIISLSITMLIPDSKQYAVIKIFPKIVNSNIAKEIPDDMRDIYLMAKEYMKEVLNKEGANEK